MARKRVDLESKLSGTVKPKGWADLVVGSPIEEGEPEAEKEVSFRKKTYLLRPAMVNEIAVLAKQEQVQVNEFVRFLLAHAIEDLKTGKLKIRAQTEIRRIVS